MTFQQKNNAVSLASFSLILIFFLLRIGQLLRSQTFSDVAMVQLWILVIGLAIAVTVFAIIFTHGLAGVFGALRGVDAEAEIDATIDERDLRIDLEGTNLTYKVISLGVFISMLTYALGQPPLVMFSLLIFFTLVGQIAGDARRLRRYRQE